MTSLNSMKMAESSPTKDREKCGKGRNCSLRAIAICPFTTVFSTDSYCRHVETRACFGKG